MPPRTSHQVDEELELLDGGHPVDERAHAFGDCEDNLDHALLERGIFDRTHVDGVVTGIPVQLLDNLAGLGVSAPEVAGPGPSLDEPGEEHREVDVERFGSRAVR